MLKFSFTGLVFEWRGPSPFFFVATPPTIAEEIESVKRELSYGWGVVPASITVGGITVKTALIPKDGTFLIPLKDAVRKPRAISAGDQVLILLEI